jgi:hypothetical protein
MKWFVLCTEKRRAEAARIREKYPDRIPVRIRSDFSFSILLIIDAIYVNHIYLQKQCCSFV